MPYPTVSVLMPTYKHEAYIGQALDSILSQDYDGQIEVHVFDDCSPDKTAQIVKGYIEKHPDVIKLYENPKNLGSGLASFAYHQISITSPFWCILESDDYWITPTALKKKIEILLENENLVGCAGNTLVIKDGKESHTISTFLSTFNLADIAYFIGIYSFYIHTSSILWRNVFPENKPPLPTNFYNIKGDPALMIMMLGKDRSIHRLDETISAYRQTGSGKWSKLSETEKKKKNITYRKKCSTLPPPRHRLMKFLTRINRHVHKRIGVPFIKMPTNFLIKIGFFPKPINFKG